MTSPLPWACKPGSFDFLNATRLFPANNPYGIPALSHAPLSALPEKLISYRTRIRSSDTDLTGTAVHFFLDDYRFETCWSRPLKALEYLSRFHTLLTPDFSLYADMPYAMQLWNTYRNRWCGCYWTSLGFQVIPTVSWSTPDSFDFCLSGIPVNSLVAVSAVGVNTRDPAERTRFMAGFREMVARLSPSTVLAYGPHPEEAYELAEIVTYPTRWSEKQA